jgi:acyl-coenzyme A synthetase/AMP-(fatty) acid ligase
VWPELPKSAANKILRRKVRERVLAGGGAGSGGSRERRNA